MIRLSRPVLPEGLGRRLGVHTDRLRTALSGCPADGTAKARTSWKSAKSTRKELTGVLSGMAAGISRCMYCGDNLGTDIDHFEPLIEVPLRLA
ncbi:hypothetical protein SAMN05421505_102238 [Sinosporangium album]|uniref:HNH endonuclease n=1 Tax=Sinosporangium album TaxID=504805 RepID=A0A1G7SCT9_9ACTN|nr:hypothetical protein SAMN05421505_102238 [Sinosporangium album]